MSIRISTLVAVSAMIFAFGCGGAKKKGGGSETKKSMTPPAMAEMAPAEMAPPAMPAAMGATRAAAKGAMSAPVKCATASDCQVSKCGCGYRVHVKGAKLPKRCTEPRKCKRIRLPKPPVAACQGGYCYQAREKPVCKTKADCHVQACRCGWLVWAKKLKKPQFCNARVNCAAMAQTAPKPAFDCVNQRCEAK
jgi:hypothetical protein